MDDLFVWAMTVTPDRLPESFKIGPHVTVVDPSAFLASIQREIRENTGNLRMRNGALHAELRALRNVVRDEEIPN